VSDWTVPALKEHLESLIKALDEKQKAIREEDLRARALTESRMDDRFEEHNRFREQINHERSTFVTRDQLDAVKETFAERNASTDKALDLREGRSKGVSATGAAVVAAVGAVASVAAILSVMWAIGHG